MRLLRRLAGQRVDAFDVAAVVLVGVDAERLHRRGEAGRGLARGARAETLAGLSGLGDLVLTCGSTQSRNMRLGMALGEGQTAEQALAGKLSVAEGAATAPVLVEAAAAAGVDMPISSAVADLLAGRATVPEVVRRLLSRPLKSEGL